MAANGGNGANDPNSAVRRELRTNYRDLMNDMNANRPALINESTLLLKEKMDQTDTLFAQVTHCREAALDAQCVASIANLGKQKIQALPTGFDNFNILEFCQKLIAKFPHSEEAGDDDEEDRPLNKLNPENWVQLGMGCQTFFKRSPALHYMFGSFEHEIPKKSPKEKKDPNAAKKEDLPSKSLPAVKPIEKNEVFDQPKDERTTLAVEQLHKLLRKFYRQNNGSPICFFEFVVNPTSFAQTIENVFHTSFLIKDGFVRIFLDSDNLPVIEPVEGSANSEPVAAADDPCHQMVMAWTMDSWREIIKSFNITTPLIPTRPTTSR